MTKLLMLPGHMCDAAVWAPIVSGLADLATCVVGDLGRRDSIESLAAQMLDEHGGRIAVAGFSFGGFVALEMARQDAARLSGLALVGTVALPLAADQHPERLRRVAVAEQDGVEAYVAALMGVYVHPDHAGDTALAEAIAGMARRVGIDALRRQVRANLARPDARTVLGDLRMPTMVLCGASDAVCLPHDHRAMAEAIPGSSFEQVPGAGHFVTLERPGVVIAAMRAWLARVAAAEDDGRLQVRTQP